MNHPIDKWLKLELAALALVVIIGIAALVRGSFLLMILGLYAIAASLMFNGLAALSVHQQSQGMKQMIRGLMLFVLASVLAIGL